MSQYPKLEVLKEKIDNYHPIVKTIFNMLENSNKIFLMQRHGAYTINDMSSGSFLIGEDKINLLVNFIEQLQQSFIDKKPIDFKVGKIEKHKLQEFNTALINSISFNDSNTQELMQVLPYYMTPSIFITTLLKDYIPNNKIPNSIFSKIGLPLEADPVVPKSVKIDKIVISAIKNAVINPNNNEEAENIKKLFIVFNENINFYKKHISEEVLTQSLIDYFQKREQVFVNLKDKNLEQNLFKSIKEIVPKNNWRHISQYFPSYPKKDISNKSLFEVSEFTTINIRINKETIYNKYNDINTQLDLDSMLSTVISVMNQNKPKEIESIIINNTSSSESVLLFLSGENINNQFVSKVLEGLYDLMEEYDNLEIASFPLLEDKWEEGVAYLKKIAHSFWINLKINEVKESNPERTKVRKI